MKGIFFQNLPEKSLRLGQIAQPQMPQAHQIIAMDLIPDIQVVFPNLQIGE